MRLLSRVIPNIVVDAAIVSTLIVGTAFIMPRIIYSMLKKDGVFNDN